MQKSVNILRILLTGVLILSAAACFAGKREKMRGKAVKYYSAGNYSEALVILNELIESDSTAYFWMDYAMSADILLREGKADSAKKIVESGQEKTKKSSDIRLLERNKEVFDNLTKQLRHQASYLVFPPYKSLEQYTEATSGSKSESEDFYSVKPDLVLVTPPSKKLRYLSQRDLTEVLKDSTGLSANEDSTGKTGYAAMETFIDIPPMISGGIDAVSNYIQDKKLYPKTEEAGYYPFGAAVVKVSVDNTGKKSDIVVLRVTPKDAGFEELALEVFNNMGYLPGIGEKGKLAGVVHTPVLFVNPSTPLERPVVQDQVPVMQEDSTQQMDENPAPAVEEPVLQEEKNEP